MCTFSRWQSARIAVRSGAVLVLQQDRLLPGDALGQQHLLRRPRSTRPPAWGNGCSSASRVWFVSPGSSVSHSQYFSADMDFPPQSSLAASHSSTAAAAAAFRDSQ